MEHKTLQALMHQLVTLPENGSPILSVYVDLTARDEAKRILQERCRVLEKTIDPSMSGDFQRAVGHLEGFLDKLGATNSRGLALFIRDGEEPISLSAEFHVAFPTEVSLDTVPNVYRLVEIKDNYDRFVVLISNEREARILEVSLGAVTRQLWTERPELRRRVGREWTKRHYQNHRRNRTDQFVKEKIDILDRIVRSGGHAHLILAGHPSMTARVRRSLPKHLEDRLLDLVPTDAQASTRDVVEATVSAFIQEEERLSQEVVEMLQQELNSARGLAVAGAAESAAALENGQADILVLAADYEPRTPDCPSRELLALLAQRSGCHVEVVSDSSRIDQLGGAACLLRYRTSPELAQVL